MTELLRHQEAPKENFSKGLYSVNIPELGESNKGKVRDSWVFKAGDLNLRVLLTTDRQSAFDAVLCTTPGKGQVLNLMSAFWFENTKHIIPNHMVNIPHPNVLIAKQAEETLPVEVVVRRYMAKSSTDTSVYHNYADQGKRTIYGIEFPEGLKANQEFPMGTVVTPTTKATVGHDEMLTDDNAREIVDKKLGKGIWDKAKNTALKIFELGRIRALKKGLILVDTKYEFGIDQKGELMLIDEVHTPDSSRYWLSRTYNQRLAEEKNPDTYDKDILRRWLAEQGFKGEGVIPRIDPKIIEQMSLAYTTPYELIVGKPLPRESDNIVSEIRSSVLKYIDSCKS